MNRTHALWPLVGGAAALLGVSAALITPADADLWGHLRFGLDMLATGSARQVDQYSFTTDRPWVNHEWLSEVILAALYRAGGPVALIGLKLAIIAACLAIVWRHYRNDEAGVRLSLFAVGVTFVGTYWRTHTIRPQLFSVLLMAIVLALVHSAERGHGKRLLWVPPLMAIWANLHGGWIVGAGVFGLWAVCRLFDRDLPAAPRTWGLIAAVMAVAATLLSPEGLDMWRFLAATVRLGRDDVQEWATTLSSPVALGIPWLAVAGTALWAWWLTKTRRPDRLLLALGLAFASFRVSRLDAFFALVVVLLWSDEIIAAWPKRVPLRRPTPPQLVVACLAVGTMTMPVAHIARPFASCLTMAGDWLPEPEAAVFVRANGLQGRLVTWFDWGQYALWHFSPALRVSFDGRRETVYSPEMIDDHRRLYAGTESGWRLLDRLNPDYIWLPNRLPAAQQLESRGWVAIFRGSASSIFARAGAGPFLPAAASPPAPRCFPGP